jgi:hypothetical protein
MTIPLQFNPKTGKLTGPAGSLSIAQSDEPLRRFLMLVEGQCQNAPIAAVAKKYGYSRQRYYQLFDAFQKGGLSSLQSKKTGPKSHYRRTDQAVRQVLRYRFLDPECSPEVIVQKLRQTHFPISLRSVHRVIADYGLQKKTLLPQSEKPSSTRSDPRRPQNRPAFGKGRRP